jgi:hypothetical protein
MPALIPVDNTLGALLIGTVLSSMCVRLITGYLSQDLIEPDRLSSIYGITWLQVYSYYNSHSSRDRWPLKFFVSSHVLCPMLGVLSTPLQVAFLMYTFSKASLSNTR